jgi:hypothetical protein
MKGAAAEPWVMTISSPNRINVVKMGPNHHFLRTFIKAQSSPIILSLLGMDVLFLR